MLEKWYFADPSWNREAGRHLFTLEAGSMIWAGNQLLWERHPLTA
jgi:hypothetical protein